jgi:MFS family permease
LCTFAAQLLDKDLTWDGEDAQDRSLNRFTDPAETAVDAGLRAATAATFAAFVASGFGLASWLARIPQLRDQLVLDPSALGLVLLAGSAGAVLALPLAGPLVALAGSRRTAAGGAVLFAAGLAGVAIGSTVGVTPVVVGLFVLGFATGGWDVAMNVQGTQVEQRLGRSVMSRFHAGFSVGTVAGSLVSAAAVAAGVPVVAHLAVVAALVAVAVPLAVRRFLPDGARSPHLPGKRGFRRRGRPTFLESGGSFAAWRDRRTVLIGLFVLAFTFAEGAANDWIAVAAIDGYGAPAWAATLAFAAFLAAMTAGRWFGPALLDRYGRVRVVRALALTGAAGAALFVFAPGGASAGPVAFAGAVLWGLGVALGFPVGMSAAADDPGEAAGRVGVVSSIGYTAFLAGPPAIGFLGAQVGVLRALTLVAALFAVAAAAAGVLAPLTGRGAIVKDGV